MPAGQWYSTVKPSPPWSTSSRIGPISGLYVAMRCAAVARSGLHNAAKIGGLNSSTEIDLTSW